MLGDLNNWTVVSTILVLAICIAYFRPRASDSHEPPALPPKNGIPFIGHLIGLLRNGHQYYAMVAGDNPPPACSLDLVWLKSYVVSSRSLVMAVQRNSKALTFEFFLNAAANAAGIDAQGREQLDTVADASGNSVHTKSVQAIPNALLGEGLNEMNSRMIGYMKVSIDELHEQRGPLALRSWVQHAITIASTDAMYGPRNPYKDPEVEKSFWIFEGNIMYTSNALLRLIAPGVVKARETLVKAVTQYLGSDLPDVAGASKLCLARNRALFDGGVKTEDIARLEASFSLALLTNTVPTTFWTLFDIYSRPELVADLREELAANAVRTEKAENGEDVLVIDLADIRQSCPLFTSAMVEVLRMRFSSATTRMVTADVQIGEWTLRRGNIVQIPSYYFNNGAASWGDSAADFEPRRFMRGSNAGAVGSQGMAKGFLTFGISPHVCPGRQFAVGEIAAITAMLLLRFDLAPEGGEWREPRRSTTALASAMTPIATDVLVTPLPRKEYESARWEFRVSEGDSRFNLPI